ncbi:coenzyme F420-reducing hydrogenase gamma subunit [Marinobacterium halophilum]|uniref:Coenzyme F420-reducing hydrogenase gamma subunit n=1 Tax=Marinobacterium halophilum TaxID=267374 RepID=A0A2P8ERE4_9GAMM|nr:sulfhydrogenase subunit delta [Marinobacterium halophilum]PSL12052.1 coenzyme F420-reducing hydrogenase gamma subunit [Marinobacterium halophilum]
MKSLMTKPRIAVHKFSSCDGCQLAFLNLGEALLQLNAQVDILHFLEAGMSDAEADVDIAFVEGSLSTPDELDRIRQVRAHSRYLVTIGACATSGGLQALRNLDGNHDDWRDAIYARPEFIHTLKHVKPVAAEVKVDLELWGCPVSSAQVLAAVRALLFGVAPVDDRDRVCLECKRQQAVCVMVTQGVPCMGPVTRTGCGALCPRFGRDCYGCYGPSETAQTDTLARRFAGLGLLPDAIARRFLLINSQAPAFLQTGRVFHRSPARAQPPGDQDD